MVTDHSTLKCLVDKPVLGGKLYRWLLLFQEYDVEVIVKPGKLNAGPNHLSRIESGKEPTELKARFPDAQLFSIKIVDAHFADIIQFLNTKMTHPYYFVQKKKELVTQEIYFTIIVGQLYKMGADEVLRRYVSEHERHVVLAKAHDGVVGGHYSRKSKMQNILRVGLWWKTLHTDAHNYFKACNKCR